MSNDGEKKKCCKGTDKKLLRPSELPLYGNPNPPHDVIKNTDSAIENGIRTVRIEVQHYYRTASDATKRVQQIFSTAFDHSKSTYEYISDEANTVPKAVAITSGGLIGLLISSRKGFFKKIGYTSLGMTVMAAVCYPKQTQELIQLSVYIIKSYGPNIIKDYTGIDLSSGIGGVLGKKNETKTLEQIGNEVSDTHYYGFRLEEAQKPNPKPVNVNLDVTIEKDTNVKPIVDVSGDYGQSNPNDRDMYANRSTK